MKNKLTIWLICATGVCVVVVVIFAPLITQWFGYSIPTKGEDFGQFLAKIVEQRLTDQRILNPKWK